MATQINGSQAADDTAALRFRSRRNIQRMKPANNAAASTGAMRLHVPFANRIQAAQRKQSSGVIHELDQVLQKHMLAANKEHRKDQRIQWNGKQRLQDF